MKKLMIGFLFLLSTAQSALADGWIPREEIVQNLCPKSACFALGAEVWKDRCEYWQFSRGRPGEFWALGPWQTQTTECYCPCMPNTYDAYAEEAKR